ncbi:MAG TPA: outer membrane protein assembly factor BamD [Allosphingosinicella sp.]|jgi:TolA-binding protein
MRYHLLGLMLLASASAPALAQRTESPERRIERLEQELKAVQRKVFPGGGTYVAPETGTGSAAPVQSGVPASSAVADLTARLDSLESQLREITGQAEQNANRVRLVEDALARFRETTLARIDTLERAGAPTAEPVKPAAATTVKEPQLPPPSKAVTTADSAAATAKVDAAEQAYNTGFRLWEQRRYGEAQQTLEAVAKRHPDSRWASWANNLAGRAYLDAGKPATAAKLFLANYQSNPKGERAADSLYFLGQALVTLDKPADACKAYAELEDVYGAGMRDWLKQRLPAARAEAKCR